jgi:hypothetical protein
MHRILVRAAWIVAAISSAAHVAVAGLLSDRPVEWRRLLMDVAGSPQGIDLRLQLQPEHSWQSERVLAAAARAVHDYADWYGSYPHDRLTIVDVPWRSDRTRRREPDVVAFETRWIVPPASLSPEADVARAISRQWWGGIVDLADPELAEELAEYSQGLIVERLFADRYGRPAYSALEARYFGAFVPWTYRSVLLDRATAARRRSGSRLVTLERYLGWPALQRALAAVVARRGARPMTRDEFFRIAGDTVGEDLHWFSVEAFEPGAAIDYAIDRLTSVAGTCRGERCFHTTVVARRNGARFTGSSRAPVGEYESGRAIGLLSTFADGSTAAETWDGRGESRTFEYESRAPAVSAVVDPDGVLVLERRTTNNGLRLVGTAAVAANRWSARWVVWLEDALLAYASLA